MNFNHYEKGFQKLNTAANSKGLVWLMLLVLCFCSGTALGQITWDGSDNDDWNTAANWDSGTVPTAADDVIIPSSSSTNFNAPTIGSDESYEVNSLTVQSSGRLEIGPSSGGNGSSLTVNGDLTNDGLVRANVNSSLALLGGYSGTGSYANSRTVYGDLSYSIFAVPFTDGNIALFNGVFAYEYNNETGGYVALDYVDAAEPGKGYFVSIGDGSNPSGTTFTLGFAGALVGDDVNVDITMGAADKFNLLGNPYSAAISVDKFFNNSNNTDHTTGVIYFWDDGGSNFNNLRAGDYVTVNSMGVVGTSDVGDGVGGVKGTSAYNGHVLTMQGFYVEATDDGVVSFTQDMQVADMNDDEDFYRSQSAENRATVKLSLGNEFLYNELLVGFDPEATENIDYSLDAKKLSGNENLSFYTKRNGEDFAILALPALSGESIVVDLGIDLLKDGTYQLMVEEMQHLPVNYTVELEDIALGASYNLTTTTKITLDLNTAKVADRFKLHFKPAEVTSAGDLESPQFAITTATKSGLTIAYSGTDERVLLYNMQGSVLIDETVRFEDATGRLSVPLGPQQVYLLKIGNEVIKFTLD